MKVVFFGTPEWAVPTLQALDASPHRPTLAVTQPTRRRKRGGAVSASPVAAFARHAGIPVVEPASVRDPAFLSRLAAEQADIFVVVAYGKLFPQSLLDLPREGAINVHFSLLPRWRGAAPVQWAIAEGETETGASTMKIVKELDAGPVYLQESTPIGPDEHAPSLGARLALAGARLMTATIEGLESGRVAPRAQDPSRVTIARMLKPEDGWIDWSSSAETIARRVRGFDPWPGQSARSRRGRLRIVEAHAASSEGWREGGRARAGTILGRDGDALAIACEGEAIILATRVVPESRQPMTGAEALRGRHVEAGEILVAPS